MMSNLRIHKTGKFIKVNNIYCVGRNYAEHIKEMNVSNIPELPIIFIKPNSAIINDGGLVEIPKYQDKFISQNMHYEVELVIAISKNGRNIQRYRSSMD